MPAKKGHEPKPFVEALTFWSIIIIISAIAAFISFRVGRDWLGKRLGDVEVSQGAPRIVAQAELNAENARRLEQEERAPDSVEPVVEDREATQAEIRRLEREEASEEPQDGAQLNSSQADDSPPADEAAQEPEPEDPDVGGAGPVFTVTAGSFGEMASARSVKSQLNDKGYSPYIQDVVKDGKTLHRVCVSQVRGRVDAQELQKAISDLGFTAGLIAGP